MKLRKKDPRRRNRMRSRRTARKALRRRRLAIVAAAALVIGVGGFFIWYQLWGCGSSMLNEVQPLKGDFVCEECDYHWHGEGVRSHRYDPYVKCPECDEKKARKAVQCPTCDEWVLPPIPEPSKPYAEMNPGEKDRWDLESRKLKREAVCPICGPIFR